jgi:hypothetical protein
MKIIIKDNGMILPMQGNPTLKEYRCPHCKRFLFKGNVKKLNMLCHHCQELIIVDGNKVIIETDES